MKLLQPLDRKTYWILLLAIVGVKTGVDIGITWMFDVKYPFSAYFTPWHIANSKAWQPIHPQHTLVETVLHSFRTAWTGLAVFMSAWIALRRELKLRSHPWMAFFALIPWINVIYLLLIGLTNERAPQSNTEKHIQNSVRTLGNALFSIFLTALVGVIAVFFHANGLANYGLSLFVATPIFLGIFSGYITNRLDRHSVFQTIKESAIAVSLVGGSLLFLALEGMICIAMAAPIAYLAVALGALIGREIGTKLLKKGGLYAIASLGALLPTLGAVESHIDTRPPPPECHDHNRNQRHSRASLEVHRRCSSYPTAN